ncbi:MAG: hypothetical protein QW575_08560, partial [Thermoproteota archaeon]
ILWRASIWKCNAFWGPYPKMHKPIVSGISCETTGKEATMRGKKKNKQLVIRVDEDFYNFLKDQSLQAGIKISELARSFLMGKNVVVAPKVELTLEQLSFIKTSKRLLKYLVKMLNADYLSAKQFNVVMDSIQEFLTVLKSIDKKLGGEP